MDQLLENEHEILNSLPDPAFVLTETGVYAAIYGGVDERYYHDGSGLVGKNLSDLLSPDKAQWFLSEISTALNSRGLHVVEYELSNKDIKGLENVEGPADSIWFEGRVIALSSRVNGERAVLWVASNRTKQHELQLKLEILSVTDELTGLYNRRRLLEFLRYNLDMVKRHGMDVLVLAWDVDNFKGINDVYGHAAGDALLQFIAKKSLQHSRSVDRSYRVGGDEFICIFPFSTIESGAKFHRRLEKELSHFVHEHDFKGLDLGLSMGAVLINNEDRDGEMVLDRADQVLYAAKREGKKCYRSEETTKTSIKSRFG
ncbi:MAG TPA: diguanylate cyclase [Marinobacterium sp.]|nr:diguanylate cyclase [Marinobacterium sp.]